MAVSPNINPYFQHVITYEVPTPQLSHALYTEFAVMHQDKNLQIREIFSILTQGVEMTQYETNSQTYKSTKHKRIVWMDSDIYRICVDKERPSMAERARGKIPPGLYLRDVSEIREGADSFHFDHNKHPPTDHDNCLSMVGSERTISLELPSKFTRDWFLVRFRLLAEDILVEQERMVRRYKIWEQYRQLNATEVPLVSQLQTLLERGVQVTHHQLSGNIVDNAILRYDSAGNTLELWFQQAGYFSKKDVVLTMNVSDISEIRPGSHSLAFVRTGCTASDKETLSIIASENVFDLQLINQTARDLFADRLFQFVLFFLVTKKSAAQALEFEDADDDDDEAGNP